MPIRSHRKPTFSHYPKNMPNTELAMLWSYKLLIKMQLWKKLLKDSYIDEGVLEFLGIADLVEDGELNIKPGKFLNVLKENLSSIEQNKSMLDKTLSTNIDKLVQVINLNENEKQILGFVVILQSIKGFQDISDELGELNLKEVFDTLSFLLDISHHEIKTALNQNNTLFQSGLVKVDRDCANELQRRIDIMPGLTDNLLLPDVNFDKVFDRYFYPASLPSLKKSNFDYLENQINLIERSLSLCKSGSTNTVNAKNGAMIKGMNILIYGPPGTGKSELSRVIAKRLGFQLHEIAMNDEDGDPVNGNERFSSFRLAQQVLRRKKNNLIVFDKIEDVFPSSMMDIFSGRTQIKGQKAWVNRLLESNEVPSIWISNAVWQIDDAYKRRFKFVLKMDIPPEKTRLKIIKNCVKKLPVSKTWLDCVAEHTELSPALISQSAQMVALMNQQEEQTEHFNPQKVEDDLNQIINNNLELMDKKKIVFNQNLSPLKYNIDALNPDCDIKSLATGLAQQQMGRLCLYGPPGTGKTAFGHYISKTLKQKLIVKRASDLLGMYVGESEKNIAQMFEQAKQDNAVLLLDEADSFLRDRKGANQSWEVTQVNELLTQMESFSGIFICSTNLIDNLDEASIRRFDLKIKLDYCQPEQVFILFKQVLKAKNTAFKRQESWRKKLSIFHNLTPGDFATVLRQNQLSSENLSPELLFNGLKRESEFKAKDSNHRGIGFVANF
ncbi:MAG: AAA family ATPase [Gammaproteobacteria bacterium]|nr:AAA family ATPase [Gammaproteobacteria bacterium]